MKKYKVIALSVGGAGKQIFQTGDVVTEKSFDPGRAEELRKAGFLAEIGEDGEPTADITNQNTQLTPKVDEQLDVPPADEEKESDDAVEATEEFKNTTRNELMEYLDAAEVEYKANSSKRELFDLYKAIPPK